MSIKKHLGLWSYEERRKKQNILDQHMFHRYKALVAPQLEYAAAVWQVGNCDPLEKIQRKGLANGFIAQLE